MPYWFHILYSAALLQLVYLVEVPPAAAWTREGHEVMGAITESLLDEATRHEVDRLLAILAPVEPRARRLPAACAWLDDVRSQGLGHFDHWHYINLPINPQRLPVPPPRPDDVVFAIRQSMTTLRDAAASDFARAFALRVLVHTVGDIHQPLHTVARFSSRLPEGDRGGNDFPIRGVGDIDNLHVFWDQGVGQFARDPAEPREVMIDRLARDFLRAVPVSELAEVAVDDPAEWAEEGRRLALEIVYPGIVEDERPSNEYLRRAEPAVRRQLVLAAHRLADLLESSLTATRPPSATRADLVPVGTWP